MSVVPHRTSTSPTSSAPATSCSAERVDRAAADQRAGGRQVVEDRADRLVAADDVGQRGDGGARRRRPAPRPSPVGRTAGTPVIAVIVSMAPRPVSAWLATAWAGQ